jgi:hypothetical protein
MYELSKVLEDKMRKKLAPGAADELGSSVKSAMHETKQLRDVIDEALNVASMKTFMPYQAEFAKLSQPINEARAMKDIYEAVATPGAPMLGRSPEITRQGLASAYASHSGDDFGLRLSPIADRNLRDLLTQLQRREQVSQSFRGGVQGVGTGSTAPSMIGGTLGQMTGTPGYAYINAAREMLSGMGSKTKLEVARLLQNPEAAASAIQQSIAANRPLSPSLVVMARLLGIYGAESAT